ncbi:hypothetical protein CcaverHIS641_0704160 [Cutaneotrichosporon cavernicola]|nr:hypothetical protein CcaverHIS641_0704160 [Cutaneotrichosporon cavernicola]
MPRLSGDELLPGTITDEPTPLGRMTPSPSPPPPYPEPEQERDQDTAPLLPAPITHTGPQAPLCDPLLFACTDIAWLDAGLCCETIGAAFHLPNGSTDGAATPRASARKQLLTLSEIDRLLTHVSQHSPKTRRDTPMIMRAHPVPWMNAGCGAPELEPPASETAKQYPPLSEQEKENLGKPKPMSASYTSFDLPLATDPRLYDLYVNFSGGFRMGKLLENLDSLAGAVAYRHCLPVEVAADGRATQNFHAEAAKAGLYIATASADRLDMFGVLNHENVRDLRFSGFVTWTGNSSMEVFVKMEGTRPGSTESDTLMLGRFAMVARDTHTGKARKVPQLIVETPEEQSLWDFGQEHKDHRMAIAKRTLDKAPPDAREAAELHELMRRARDAKDNTLDGEIMVPMADTVNESVQLMFPQERNLHGKVFGGFLMRQAYELCFTTAATFAHAPMRFQSLDQIVFRLPVPIGAIVRLTSKVLKTTKPTDEFDNEAKAHIMVKAEVEDVETGDRQETNTFYFTMKKPRGKVIGRTVVPSTYYETMQYLEGSRRLEVGDEVRKLYMARTPANEETGA